jgi:hypothetical protein
MLDLGIAEKDAAGERLSVQLAGERLAVSDDASFKEALYRQVHSGKTIFSMTLALESDAKNGAESSAPLPLFSSRNKPVQTGPLALFLQIPVVLLSLLPTACCMNRTRARKQQP